MWHPDMPEEYRDQIVTGDARELAKAIPDESVDLIFTDPPYEEKSLWMYEWISQEASRVLKSGALCFTYMGKYRLDRELADLSKHLEYVWAVNLWEPGEMNVFHPRKVVSRWRPIMVYSRGKANLDYCMDGIESAGRDKKYHKWGQELAAPSYYIRKLTTQSSVIWEPCTGGGTVPTVCKMLSRHYIAFEIDPATADRARQRVANTQPPLPGLVAVQEALAL